MKLFRLIREQFSSTQKKTACISFLWYPIGTLIICFLCFSSLIFALGLYWDDWPSLWFLHTWGPTIFPQAFASDRPVQGWLWVLTTGVLGESILVWQFFGIITRWLSGLALGWSLYQIWPERKRVITWIVILFLVYPGFLQQYIPMTYSHMFIVQAIFFASLGLMVSAIRANDSSPSTLRYWTLTSFSVLLTIMSWFTLEYFTGLELLRPYFLWVVVSTRRGDDATDPIHNRKNQRSFYSRVKSVLLYWLPFAISGLFFLVWRIHNITPRANVQIIENLAIYPLITIRNLLFTIFQDLYESTFSAWGQTFTYLNTAGLKQSVILAYSIIVIISVVFTILFLLYSKSVSENKGNPTSKSQTKSALSLIALGFYSLFIAGWPIWATDLFIELRFPWDRFTLVMMVGAAILFIGFLELLIRPLLPKIILIGIAVGLAAGAQFHLAMQYRQEWNDEKAFFQQLSWRVPGIKPGTLLLISDMPFSFVTDNSLTAPINWVYAPGNTSTDMSYLLFDLSARVGNRLPNLEQGTVVQETYRVTNFVGSTSQALVLSFIPPRCLKIIDPIADSKLPNKPDWIRVAMHLSRPELIETHASPPAVLPINLFGPEPPPDWCYYFEKAELSAQNGDWDQVIKLATNAFKLNYPITRENAHELVPFIQGYAHLGKWEDAIHLSLEGNHLSDKMQYLLCDVWYGINQTTPSSPEQMATVSNMKKKFNCTFP